jgi:hypothetical protein
MVVVLHSGPYSLRDGTQALGWRYRFAQRGSDRPPWRRIYERANNITTVPEQCDDDY